MIKWLKMKLAEWVLPDVPSYAEGVSADLRRYLGRAMVRADAKAKASPNPVDNLIVMAGANLFGVDLGGKK